MKSKSLLFWFSAGLGAGLAFSRLGFNPNLLTRHFTPPVLSWMVRDRSLAELAAILEASGQRASRRLIDTHPSRRNYHLLNHVTDIERWGQDRLKSALGQPLKRNEYDSYRPPRSLSWNELQDEFAKTRRETLDLIRSLDETGVANARIPHNSFGDLTVAGWLFYLILHARWELSKIR